MMTNVDCEDGVMTVNVELENESTFGRIATENLDKAAKELINEHDKQIDKILKMEDDKDVRTVANMILPEYGENIRWKKQPKCVRTLRKQKLIDKIDTSISKRAKELREIFDIKEQKYEPKDGDFVYVKAGYEHIAIFKKEVGEDMYVYANWNMSFSVSKIIIDDSRPLCCIQKLREIRPATEREKKILIDQLAKVNKKWNEEKKCLEDVRWRAKEGEPYSYLLFGDTDILVTTTTDMRIYKDDERFNSGNYFKTVEAAEKVAEKIRDIFKNSKSE